ncbi:hypothetical protein EUTSA_v10000198mg [Eutrema salsugineum]|uniref:KIB1-4 beta-propeller domain-containing protein n=2 Tax=Eutrema salsugineum TaxID=72664 RepID=V4M2M7_EUTSA|nr:hypothetical protein EUTSA_v10000198mg [Eutrema salsugineum]
MKPDWIQLPEELLCIITKKLDNCFDVVHARSVCSLWRSTFPYPSCLLRPSYSFPTFGKFPYVSKKLCTLEKVPLFLFRVQTPLVADKFLLGGVGRDKSEDHMNMMLPSPIQCSVKVEIPGSDPTLMNIHDSQIFPLGHQYRMIGWYPNSRTTKYRGVAFLPLNKNGSEFVVLLNYTNDLLMLRSDEMRWMCLKETSEASCVDLVSFRGRFYATFLNGDIFAFDPYSLIRTPMMPVPDRRSCHHLVQSGDDELFLVGRFNPFPESDVINFNRFICIVSRLDEKAGEWVVVSDLGDRVFFIGQVGNVCCLAKELPDGCGLSKNSIVFTDEPGNVTYAYKYGVHTENAEDGTNCWRFSRENRVTILNTSSMVALRVERQAINVTLDT